MIKQNIANQILLIHFKESNIFRFLKPGETMNAEENFDTYEKVSKTNSLKELKKVKKIRI